MVQGDKAMSEKQGFTFTISMLLLCLTLISMAAYAPEWRKSQLDSFALSLPFEGLRLQERISAGVAELLGADASVRKNISGVVSTRISGSFPFKKEGEPIARIDEYANSLPYSLRGTGAEPLLSANSLVGSNATVMVISGTGSLVYNNDGFQDMATYYHPGGWAPSSINFSINCIKPAGEAGSLSIQEDGVSPGPAYYIVYGDASSYSLLVENTTANEGNASFGLSFEDGTSISFESIVSSTASSNYTQLTYTKSPKGFLILPFEQNASIGEGQVRDYSERANNMTLGGGNTDFAPAWTEEGCRLGACYSFDGSNDFINRTDFSLTETQLEFRQGLDRILNGGLENHTNNTDDGITDSWANWTLNGSAIFDSTTISVSGHAMKISSGTAGNFTQQQISMLENVPYTLSFFTKSASGTGSGSYAIYDAAADRYLQADGNWGSEYFFDTGVTATIYTQVSRQFSMPAGSNAVQIRLAPSEGDQVFFDSIILRQSVGLNGGFEYYFPDTTN